VEKIIYYKDDKLKLFHGGPINRTSEKLKWMSILSFEDEFYKTRAVYELSFINCGFHDAEGAEILFVKVSDINIKFKNTLSNDLKIFADLLDGKYSAGKYVIVRYVDTSIVFYPEVFIAGTTDEQIEKKDKEAITELLCSRFKTKKSYVDYYNGGHKDELDFENEQEISYKPFLIIIELKGTPCEFFVRKKILKHDPWKLYYVISKTNLSDKTVSNNAILLRIDSGCVSGQIYDDETCDCLDQLHEGLYQISREVGGCSLIIHIPAHDGRGFGTAPKAETEIYKRGGQGRVHTTKPLDTIAAAKLLYENLNYDLRTYDGAAKIIKSLGFHQVILLTDNKMKVSALERNGIKVIRKQTGTEKKSCANHIIAKQKSENYFDELWDASL
jgi:GTP cyclohydrolase II